MLPPGAHWLTAAQLAARQYWQLYLLFWQALGDTMHSRWRHGPRRPTWSSHFELMVHMLALGLPMEAAFDAAAVRTPWNRLTGWPLPWPVAIQPTVAGGVPGEWVTVGSRTPGPVLLFLHGGGYFSGSPHTHRLLIIKLARSAHCRVLALDYRLAPEHAYPAAVADAWCAYWWLLTSGVAPGQIIVAGDSAGGGLTLALLLALRDAHVPLPAGAVCLSPWLDLALTGESLRANQGLDYLNEQVLRGAAAMYLNGADPQTPLASPLYADLHGLPPLLIQAGATELLADDSIRFSERARAAGVEVTLQLWEDVVHVFHFFYLLNPAANQAMTEVAAFIHRQTSSFTSAGI